MKAFAISLFCSLLLGCATNRHNPSSPTKVSQRDIVDLDEWKPVPDPAEAKLAMSEVNRLSIASALLKVPRTPGDWQTMIGLPKVVRPSWGGMQVVDGQWATYTLYPLRREPDDSLYALKVWHSIQPSQLVGVHLVLVVRGKQFLPDPRGYPLEHIVQLKAMMRDAHQTPAEFTARLPEYLGRVQPERPNKAPEPTPGSVTPRATEGVSK